MNKHIQIREVPEETHRQLKSRAAAEGLSMSDYLKRLIERDLTRPNWEAIRARISGMDAIELSEPAAAAIRRDRDSR